jgi:hypothetical protein
MKTKKNRTDKPRLPYLPPRIAATHVIIEDFLASSNIDPSVSSGKIHYIDYDDLDKETPADSDVLII